MRINSTEVLGQAIRARRKELGYSQQQMADYCGCGTRFISDLENGKETIQFGKALGVASMLGLDLSIDVRGGAMSESLKVLQGGVLVGALDKGNSEPFYGFTYDEA